MKFPIKQIKKSESGFTLMELMIVIAIIGILSGMAIWTSLGGLPERRVMSASRQLYGGIQKTRSYAINRGQNIRITFNRAANSYQIADLNPTPTIFETFTFPGFINMFSVTGGGAGPNIFSYNFNSRGQKQGVFGTVSLQYSQYAPGQKRWQVVVTPAGGVTIQDF